jgi:hypothetical protein
MNTMARLTSPSQVSLSLITWPKQQDPAAGVLFCYVSVLSVEVSQHLIWL